MTLCELNTCAVETPAQELVVVCTGYKQGSQQDLSCRFGNGTVIPAQLDAETQRISCQLPQVRADLPQNKVRVAPGRFTPCGPETRMLTPSFAALIDFWRCAEHACWSRVFQAVFRAEVHYGLQARRELPDVSQVVSISVRLTKYPQTTIECKASRLPCC
jgi:hypothetical protein